MTIHSKLPSKTKSVKAGRRAKRAVLAQKRTLLLETLEARTMLSVTPNLGILVLDPTGSGALTRSGNGSMVVSNGDIVIDSNNATAGKFSGSSGTVSASNVFVAGKLSNTGGGKIVGTVVAGSPALADPLALLPQPTAPATQFKNTSIVNKTVTLSPGTYVNGIAIGGTSTVTLLPGLYYLQGGGLNISGNSKLTGTGVTIFNAPAKSTDAINLSSNAIVTLSAPTSGISQGIVIFQNRASNVPLTISATNVKLTGEIYSAGAALNVSGNLADAAGGNGTTIPGAIIARDLTESGNGALAVSANPGGISGDLSITKTDNLGGSSITSIAGTYSAGGTITYTITVSNSGPSEAIGATVADAFPAAISSDTFTVATTGGAVDVTHAASGSGNINDAMILPTGSSITYTVSANISASTGGQLSNTATATAPGTFHDTNTANNSATDVDNSGTDLSVAITDSNGGSSTGTQGTVLSSGQNIYTILVVNNGPGSVTGASVTDTFSSLIASDSFTVTTTGGASDTTNASSGSGNISDSVNMPSGSTIQYTVTGTLTSTAYGTLSDTATVAVPAGTVDTNTANNSATDTDIFTTPNTSTVWSGYAITTGGSTATAVGGSFNVPTIAADTAAGAQVSIWVGIDGFGNSTVEQDGIAWSGGSWVPWIEFFGDAKGPVPPNSNKGLYYDQTNITSANFPGTGVPSWNITAGDLISASVVWDSDTATTSTFTFELQDVTLNQSWSDTLTTSYIVAARTTAEWIVESPSGATKPLADFGTDNFTNSWATLGGFSGPITAFTNFSINMTPNTGVGGGTTTTGGFSNTLNEGLNQPSGASSNFSVTFISADPPADNSNTVSNNRTFANEAFSSPFSGGRITSSSPAIANFTAAGLRGGSDASISKNSFRFDSSFGANPEILASIPSTTSVDNWFANWNGDNLRLAPVDGQNNSSIVITPEADSFDAASAQPIGSTGDTTNSASAYRTADLDTEADYVPESSSAALFDADTASDSPAVPPLATTTSHTAGAAKPNASPPAGRKSAT